jgi:hypothetical protein
MSYATSYALFSAQGSNANGSAVEWRGGRGVFEAHGTFGSGTCKLQWSPDDGTTWLDVDRSGDDYVTLAADGGGAFELRPCKIRAVLSGATNPSITATVATSKS